MAASLLWHLPLRIGYPYGWPSYDNFYFPYCTLLTMWLVVLASWRGFRFVPAIVLRPIGISPFYKFLQLSSLYEFLYLLFQVSAVFSVMFVIFMENVVFPLVTNMG